MWRLQEEFQMTLVMIWWTKIYSIIIYKPVFPINITCFSKKDEKKYLFNVTKKDEEKGVKGDP